MSFKLYIIALLVLSLLYSCKKENACDCVKSAGKTNVIYHDRKDFTCISVVDKIETYISQGPNFEVKVEAGENLQPLIKTELDGETLKVFNNNKCNWVRGYKHKIKVFITAPYYKYIVNDGIGTIESLNTINQDYITLRNTSGDLRLNINVIGVLASTHGEGDVYLSGKTENIQHVFTGTNSFYASNLEITNYMLLKSVTIGKAYINAPANGRMDVIIEQSGNVYYKGNPGQINLTRNNKGDLIRE